jgi:hypothetical protein
LPPCSIPLRNDRIDYSTHLGFAVQFQNVVAKIAGQNYPPHVLIVRDVTPLQRMSEPESVINHATRQIQFAGRDAHPDELAFELTPDAVPFAGLLAVTRRMYSLRVAKLAASCMGGG